MKRVYLTAIVLYLTAVFVTSTAVAAPSESRSEKLARLRAPVAAQLQSRGPVKSDPLQVRQHLIDLVTLMPDLRPGDEAYARRMADLRSRLESLSAEETAALASVDDESLAPAVAQLQLTAAARRQIFVAAHPSPTPNLVGPASHPLLDDSAIYDGVCNSTFASANDEKNETIALNVAQLAAIAGDAACFGVVVILGEGTTLPQCIAVAIVHEVVEGLRFDLDTKALCDGDISREEGHATFKNLYHLHNDLINSVTNDDQNKDAVIADVDSKSAALSTQVTNATTSIISNANANTSSVIANDNANTSSVISNQNDIKTAIINNSNANRDTVINNSNANRDTVINEMRNVACELDRLMNTPEGQRSSSIASCSGQPGFPYRWAHSVGNPSTSSVSAPVSTATRAQDGVPILAMMGTVTMETNLLDGRMIPSYYLPASRGGMIEQVQTLVWNTINAQLDLVIAADQTEQARVIAREADQLLVQQRFVEAYRKYAGAYRALVPAAPQPGEAAHAAR